MPDDSTEANDSPNSGQRPRPAVRREFLVEVVLLNLAVLSFVIGAMLVYATPRTRTGVGLVLIGVVALLATIRRYRKHAPNS